MNAFVILQSFLFSDELVVWMAKILLVGQPYACFGCASRGECSRGLEDFPQSQCRPLSMDVVNGRRGFGSERIQSDGCESFFRITIRKG